MELDYGELFGVDVASAENPEVAEPETDTESNAQGVEEQEVTDPVASEEDEIENVEENGEDAEEDKTQNAEDRTKYAAARRQAEQKAKEKYEKQLEEALERQRKEFESKLAQVNFESPFTKKPVQTVDELDMYLKERLMKQNRWDEKDYEHFVQNLPEVQAAREATRKAEEAEAKAVVDAQLKEIAAFDPTIKTLDDIRKMENYDAFYKLVQRGNSFVEAYKLLNFEKLQAEAAAKSKQAAINAVQSKRHLQATSQRGAGAVTVPDDIKAEYRAMIPGISDDEIQKHYNRYVSGNKK